MEPLVGIDAATVHEHQILRHIGSVVSGDPQRGQYRRATWKPLEPISSKTAVSPSISIVERLIMMTVEKALPDCGRQRSQWQRPAAIGCAEIL